MTFSEVVFLDQYPKLDLHGEARESARVRINEFIEDNRKLKQEIIVIVHGIGSGILKEMTHETLKKNRKVIEFKTYYYNQGCTIVRLNVEKEG